MNWQREFFKLAGTYLACRQHVLSPPHAKYPRFPNIQTGVWVAHDIDFNLMGMRDYAFEMRLLLADHRAMNAETTATVQAKLI